MNKNKNSSLISLLLLIGLVAVGIFWLKPNLDAASALKVTEMARQEEKTELEQQLKTLQEAQVNLSGAGEIEQQTVLVAIPEKFEQDKLINSITAIARKNDVNIGSISFSIPFSSTELIKKGSISISMTGNESDLNRLLKGLESSPRKLVVKSITVQLGQTEGLDRVNFSISLENYFQKGI